MMLAGFLFLLFVTAQTTSSEPQPTNDPNNSTMSPVINETASNDIETGDDAEDYFDEESCSYESIYEYLKENNNKTFSKLRPVQNHTDVTVVKIQMVIFGILDVKEVDQSLVLYVWIYMHWPNKRVFWDYNKYCGLREISIPSDEMWKPDLTIEEMTEKDKSTPSPFVILRNNGRVEYRNDRVIVSTCTMQVYKFPLDKQSCTISFRSTVYSDKQLTFYAINETDDRENPMEKWSHQYSQYEWQFINMTWEHKTVRNFGFNQTEIVYTIRIKRRPIHYIVNFLVPITFLLLLDFASFLISDSGGEKLSFKVTVLLAVTVMQLILNEILPSSSDKIPLISVYCIGIFGLMLVNLLETIVMMYLMEKDQDEESEENKGKASAHNCFQDVSKWSNCGCNCGQYTDETPSELLSVTKEGSSRQLTEDSHGLEKVSNELREMLLLLNNKEEKKKPGYWTAVANAGHKMFMCLYITVACIFVIVIICTYAFAGDE